MPIARRIQGGDEAAADLIAWVSPPKRKALKEQIMSDCTPNAPEYKVFFLDDQGKIKKVKDLKEVATDEEAISQARALLDGRRLELFEGCRFVRGFSSTGAEQTSTGIGKPAVDSSR